MTWNPAIERERLENLLTRSSGSFTGTYMAVGGLESLLRDHPAIVQPETVQALADVISRPDHNARRQSFFLYRAAAETLIAIIQRSSGDLPAVQAMDALRHVICTMSGQTHRAASEALGRLPLDIRGPELEIPPLDDIPRIRWDIFLKQQNIRLSGPPVLKGRSMTVPVDEGAEILVVKLARADDSLTALSGECLWAEWLRSDGPSFSGRFDIPEPLHVGGSRVFRIDALPLKPPPDLNLYPGNCAIAFLVTPDYFVYPNDHRRDQRLSPECFTEIICRNARLMGQLTGSSIIHTAPIPLFHNRVQRGRREDRGVYLWQQGGRLDQWLFSCRYPNFGASGLRDFEHLEPLDGSTTGLYSHIGNCLLSLMLVTGSYFRNKSPEQAGFASPGVPVDVRHLFDPDLLTGLIRDIFLNYYRGFTGLDAPAELPDLNLLAARMIDEMGVDNYMEEILRIADQDQMSDTEFRAHLRRRGYGETDIASAKKGEQEIVLHTGPHLGGFNQRISLPEMIHFLETAAALCIADRYRQERLRPE